MSTRCIIKVRDPDETWSVYHHGDGYPDGVGQVVKDLVKNAPEIDPNSPRHKPPDTDKSHKKYVPNVSQEAAKFAAVLCGVLWEKNFCGAYLTTRDAEKELADGGGTDVEFLYGVEILPTIMNFTALEETEGRFETIEHISVATG